MCCVRARRILVVDDDQVTQRLAARALELAGFEVATLDTGFGLAVKIRDFSPDLILLDIGMPGLSGDRALGVAAAVKSLDDVNGRVVFFSGKPDHELSALAQQRGVSGWLCKPCAPAELVRRVNEFLNGKRTPTGVRAPGSGS